MMGKLDGQSSAERAPLGVSAVSLVNIKGKKFRVSFFVVASIRWTYVRPSYDGQT